MSYGKYPYLYPQHNVNKDSTYHSNHRLNSSRFTRTVSRVFLLNFLQAFSSTYIFQSFIFACSAKFVNATFKKEKGSKSLHFKEIVSTVLRVRIWERDAQIISCKKSCIIHLKNDILPYAGIRPINSSNR
jgi:hypothetical protein